jgi:hypothetical protein
LCCRNEIAAEMAAGCWAGAVVAAGANQHAILVNMSTGGLQRAGQATVQSNNCAALSPDGTVLAICGGAKTPSHAADVEPALV